MNSLMPTIVPAQKEKHIYGLRTSEIMNGLRLGISVESIARRGVSLKPLMATIAENGILVVGFGNQTRLLLIYLMML